MYDRPVALACDNTNLNAMYSTYWDPNIKVHLLVGGVGGPHAVANADELRKLFATLLADDKAMKVRL